MCGVLGYISSENTNIEDFKQCFSRAQSILRFRGPDNQGKQIFQNNGQFIAFGHSRLSIIDLNDNANQPFFSTSKQTLIVFNGEIYNYLELKKELVLEGCIFRTNSDTEVIVNAYERWGIKKTLKRLDGMFAFGLYDFRKSKLLLARDRFGKKPLYYYNENKEFIFGSDIRALKELANTSFSIDNYAFNYYLTELSTPRCNSIWKEVKKLPPANYLEVQINEPYYKINQEEFWRLDFSGTCNSSFSSIVEKTDLLLSNAVKKRLVADVRVAALLSGGIDSSLVVAKMAEHSSRQINTYTVGFRERNFDESVFARQVSNKFQTNHTEIILDSNVNGVIDNLIYEYGEPFGDSSMIPSYLICKHVSKNEKVVLGGDGGDEFFAGYDNYYKAYKFDKIKKYKVLKPIASIIKELAPSYRTSLLEELLTKAQQPYHRLLNRGMGYSYEQLDELLNESKWIKSTDYEHSIIYNSINTRLESELLKVMNASLQTRLLNDYLVKVDRASMYASLEMRSPFLDKDLAMFAASLKPKQLYHNGEPKAILKQLALRYFSHSFVYRKKMGFGVPIIEWLIQNNYKGFEEVIFAENKYTSFNHSFLKKLLNQHLNGEANHSHRLWLIYVFNKWTSFN